MKKFTLLLMLILVCLLATGMLASCSEEEESSPLNASCNHTFGEWVVSKKETCTEAGFKERFCYFCNDVIGMTVEPTGHNWLEATCQAPKTCSACLTTEGELGAHVEVVIPKIPQNCIDEGRTEGIGCSVCDAVLVAPEVIPPHFRKEIPAKPSTCSKEGSTAGERCYVCNITLIEPQVISVHEPVIFPGLAPTCVTTGLTKGTTCTECGEAVSGQFTTEFIDHTYDENGYCTQCSNKKPSEGLIYIPMANGAYYAVSGIGSCADKDVVISPTYNGKLVKYIYTNAFINCTDITSVTIPNTVLTIGDYAFYNCSSLKTVTMSDSVVNIRSYAFALDFQLESIKISSGVKFLDESVFQGCAELFEFEGGVCYVDNWAISYFYDVEMLENDDADDEAPLVYSLREGTIGIGTYAFYDCKAVEIVIPDSVLYINDNAFAECKELTKLSLPASLTSISNNMLENCEKLASVSIPANVTKIGEMAFYNCRKITEITIPSEVSEIGVNAFSGTSISTVTFENVFGWYASDDGGVVLKPMYVNLAEELAQKLKITYADHVWSRIPTVE